MFWNKSKTNLKRSDQHDNNDRKKKRPILKFFLVGCGTITLLLIGAIIWIYVAVFAGPGVMEMSEYHPFRSPEAKERYLKLYDERAKHWPVTSETRTIETSYGQTFVRISGPADAPPLVLLPGAGGTSLTWLPNIEALSENYRTYAVDNINDFGRSVYTRPISSPDDLVNWLDELFGALELGDNIKLVGLSYGGWLTSQYALRFPHRLDKIVLLAPAATILPFPGEWAWRGVLTIIPHRYFLKSMVSWLFEDLIEKDEASRKQVEQAVDDVYVAMRCFKFKMLVNPTVLRDDELQSIRVPTLFLVGENEKIYPAPDAVRRLNTVAPQVATEIIPNCGHDLTFLQADMVNRKVLAFLKQP
jgi:pimeloyl-ACP methyl ester carboxylesterase